MEKYSWARAQARAEAPRDNSPSIVPEVKGGSFSERTHNAQEDPRSKRLSNILQFLEPRSRPSSINSMAASSSRASSPLYTYGTNASSDTGCASTMGTEALPTTPEMSKRKTAWFEIPSNGDGDSAGSPRRKLGDSLPLRLQSHTGGSGSTTAIRSNAGVRLQAELRRARSQTSMEETITTGPARHQHDAAKTLSSRQERNSWQAGAQSTGLLEHLQPRQTPVVSPQHVDRSNVYQLTDMMSELILEKGWGISMEDVSDPEDIRLPIQQLMQELSQVINPLTIRQHHASLQIPVARYGQSGNSAQQVSYFGGPNSAPSGGSAKRKNHQSQREDDDAGAFRRDDDDGKDQRHDGSRKMAKLETCTKYSCPFRKRNPARFNVRDHSACANTSYSNISNLKKHIKIYHGPQNECERCRASFPSEDELRQHKMLPSNEMCEVKKDSPASQNNSGGEKCNPEDGISHRVKEKLEGRQKQNQIMTWNKLWITLFPNDRDDDIRLPDFVYPVVAELHEVHALLSGAMKDLNGRLVSETESILRQMELSGPTEGAGRRISEMLLRMVMMLHKTHCKDFEDKIVNSDSTPSAIESVPDLGRPSRSQRASSSTPAAASPDFASEKQPEQFYRQIEPQGSSDTAGLGKVHPQSNASSTSHRERPESMRLNPVPQPPQNSAHPTLARTSSYAQFNGSHTKPPPSMSYAQVSRLEYGRGQAPQQQPTLTSQPDGRTPVQHRASISEGLPNSDSLQPRWMSSANNRLYTQNSQNMDPYAGPLLTRSAAGAHGYGTAVGETVTTKSNEPKNSSNRANRRTNPKAGYNSLDIIDNFI